jgi:thiamine kinase-like enzyme
MVDLTPPARAALSDALRRLGWPELVATDEAARIGGVTNTSYRLRTATAEVVLRLPGVATGSLIERRAEQKNCLAMSRLGIDVPLLAFDEESGVKVTRYLANARSPDAGELRHPTCLAEICNVLRRVHGSELRFGSAFCPIEAGQRFAAVLRDKGCALPAEFLAAQAALDECQVRLQQHPAPQVPCHQDLFRDNWLWADGQLHLIDWEHSGLNDPVYDLADLSVQAEFDESEDTHLLGLYHQPAERTESVHRRFRLHQQVSRLSWGLWALTRACLGFQQPAHRQRGVQMIETALRLLRRC